MVFSKCIQVYPSCGVITILFGVPINKLKADECLEGEVHWPVKVPVIPRQPPTQYRGVGFVGTFSDSFGHPGWKGLGAQFTRP